MFVGVLTLDVVFGDVQSLKEKRSLVRPLVAEIRRRFEVSVGEVGYLDLHRRAEIGVAVVGLDAGFCTDVLEKCERLVAERPELELLSARTRLISDTDD